MPSRKINFVAGEYYHVYNRGVDKRRIFGDEEDIDRFLQSIVKFNTKEPIGSIYENSFVQDSKKKPRRLISLIAYCLNPNHYHLIIKPRVDKGVEYFMQRLGTGYSLYFNTKYRRSGSLFQGKFKATLIDINEYLLHLSSYVNLNYKAHQLGGSSSKLVRSSWEEYVNPNFSKPLCEKNIVLSQFSDTKEYTDFANSALTHTLDRKKQEKELRALLID
ncbi:MAG: transposase [Patescibacteria group bacterium]|nr:transposase [Patescibacteria group bacterium]